MKNALAQTAKLKADLLSKANVEYDIKHHFAKHACSTNYCTLCSIVCKCVTLFWYLINLNEVCFIENV
ncbi:hypothetical protein EJD97_012975, partial [Solanum chilense]